jgi:hypothetical protein
MISIEGLLEYEQGLSMGELLTVKIRQPSHEFTFGVGMNFASYFIGTNPRGITSSLVHVGFGVKCLRRVLTLKARLPG